MSLDDSALWAAHEHERQRELEVRARQDNDKAEITKQRREDHQRENKKK